jgi:Mg-chelatase subunit ChlD
VFAAQKVSGRPAGRPRPVAQEQTAGFTDDVGDEVVLAQIQEQVAAEPAVRELAHRIAARLSVPRPRLTSSSRRGQGVLASVPYRGAATPVPEDEDVIVRDRVKATRAVVLAVDVSGSTRGERIKTAAATVGALAAELDRDRLAVVAFWSDAAILSRLGDPVRPDRLLDDLLRIPARGLTNVAFPLQLAAAQLAGVPERDARVLLLSDCVHNAGPDPRPLAAGLPRLDVLLDVSGEKDVELGRELAAAGRGRLRLVRGYHDVGPAISDMFRES